MKNILLKSLYQISDQPGQPYPASNMIHQEAYLAYRKMQDLSIQSANRYLEGDWELIELSGYFDTLSESFYHTYMRTQQLWHEHAPCNIVYLDPDILLLKPTRVFGVNPGMGFHTFDEATCSARSFAHNMSPKVWHKGNLMAQSWDHSIYDYEQQIYNVMGNLAASLATDVQKEKTATPGRGNIIDQHACFTDERAETLTGLELDQLINVKLNEFVEHPSKHMVHFHSSRIPVATMLLMEAVWNRHLQQQ